MAKPKSNPDPAYQAKLASYAALVATLAELELKGANNPYTSRNGHMFSYLHPDGRVALRLPTGAREAFLERYGTSLFAAYGIVQKEYVTVPDALLADTAELAPHLRAGFDYVGGLKPKPTKTAKT
jgi:hypothetical protein